MELEVVGVDLSAPEQLAQDVHGVLAFARGQMRARELVKHLGEPRLAARHSREVLPRLLATPAQERAPRGLEAAARAEKELGRFVELSAGLKRRRRGRQAAGAAEESRRPVVVLQLAEERRRLLDLSRRREGLRRRRAIPAALVERGGFFEAPRLFPGVRRPDEVARSLEEARGAQRLSGPAPRVGRGHEVAPALGLACEKLLRALLVARSRRRERGLREGAAPLEGLDRFDLAAALHEELAGEEEFLRVPVRLGGIPGFSRVAVGVRGPLPQRRADGPLGRRLGEPPARLPERRVVAERLGDLGEPVPAGPGARQQERLLAELLGDLGLAGGFPRARGLPRVGVAGLVIQARRLAGAPVALLERSQPGPCLGLLEHPARALRVARLQVRLAGVDPVAGVLEGLRGRGFGMGGLSEPDREETDEKARDVDRVAQRGGAPQELEEGRGAQVARRRLERRLAREKRDDVEDLVEMRGHEEADAHHEDENRGAEPLADRDSAQVQGLHDEPPEDEDDEHRPDLGREVEALRHEPAGEIARFRMGTRPVHRAHEAELGRERENQGREVVFPVSGRHGCTIMSDSRPRAPDGRTAAAVQSLLHAPAGPILLAAALAAALPAAAQSYSDPGTGYGLTPDTRAGATRSRAAPRAESTRACASRAGSAWRCRRDTGTTRSRRTAFAS